jgi:hypothetical protein
VSKRMNKQLLSFAEAKQIPITEYLARSGFYPTYVRSYNHWYVSPFRTEKEPSFKVDAKKNVWFDYGAWEGGTIIDLEMKFRQCSPYEALRALSGQAAKPFSIHRTPSKPTGQPEEKLEVLSSGKLVSTELLYYLRSRGIDASLAQHYCVQVEFRIREGTYTAIGFVNRSGGYELRNRWFKGASSPKDISLLVNNQSKLSAFEGFIDFLSAQQINNDEVRQFIKDSDIMVLNSVSLLKRSTSLVRSYAAVSVFFDNDPAGSNAKEYLKTESIPFRDASFIYRSHKDVNEYLVNHILKNNINGSVDSVK